MQHNLFMSVPTNNKGFNDDQQQCLDKCNPERAVQDVDDDSTKSQ